MRPEWPQWPEFVARQWRDRWTIKRGSFSVTNVTHARGQHRLTIALSSDEPPREFRIFTAGEVDTVKGKFLFDEAAAKSVMAEYAAHGIDVMLDYDHASLGPAIDPAQAGKAAGWCNLEIRDGELWAVNIRWTDPAAEALKRKEWRFMSPAFSTDEEGRITSLLNVAITNLPATRKLEPLMAASVKELSMLSPETVKKALAAIKDGDADAAMALLEEMIAGAAGGDAPAEDPPAEEMAEDPPAPAEEDEEEQAAVAASISRLTRITGKDTIGAAVDEVETWRASHLKIEAETAKLAKEREALELGQRKENAAKLVKLGAETPHTSGLAKGKLVKRLLDEPLDEQTKRVAELLAAKGGKLPAEAKPPMGDADGRTFKTPHGEYTLTEREVRLCTEKKLDPAKYAANRAATIARSNSKHTGA
jgi:phage I-like protein